MSLPSLPRRGLGGTGLEVTAICIGTSPLAGMAQLYGYDVTEERAIATIDAVLSSPIRFIDTSNGYGRNGEAEKRIGGALARRGGLPSDVVLATKVDPDPGTGDFSGNRVRASFEESLQRLGVDRVPLLYLHDPERIPFEEAVAPDGPVAALVRLREEGRVDHIGVAGGPVELLDRYLGTGEFELVLSHNRYTLLDRSAEALFASAHERGIGTVNAAPYGGGMLAKGPEVQSSYAYGRRDSVVGDAAHAMASACARYEVPLAAAALQFSLRSASIDATVVGVSSPERVAQTIDYSAWDIPLDLWAELETLVPASDQWMH